MRRVPITPRSNVREKLERLGFTFHTLEDKPYWIESSAYVFDADEIELLESATRMLHEMCLAAVERVLDGDGLDRLGIPEVAHRAIIQSWNADSTAIYGRFDLCYDGVNPPKMLEYNADTPTSLLEAAVIQWHWLLDVEPSMDQFNSIWEGLVAKWSNLKTEGRLPGERVHFACLDQMEDVMTTAVMMDTASEAGLKVSLMQMPEIGWDTDRRCFVDRHCRPIESLFKLYPWEWLLKDRFGTFALDTYGELQWIEPIWKMVLSNKGILAILWEMYPGHPNLLPAYLDGPRDMEEYVRKPLLGREGANVSLFSGAGELHVDGPYGDGGYVYQRYARLPRFEGNHAVIGSWVIDGEARGIGVRESDGPITEDNARFVPHYFKSAPPNRERPVSLFETSMNAHVVQLAPIPVVMFRHVGPYEELSPVFDRLWDWVNGHGVPAQRTIGIYWDNPDYVSAGRLRSAACVEVPPYFSLGDRDGLPLTLESIAGGSYMTTRFVGPYEDLAPVWSELTSYIERQLRLRISNNPAFEVYVNDASTTPPDQLITELYMPLA